MRAIMRTRRLGGRSIGSAGVPALSAATIILLLGSCRNQDRAPATEAGRERGSGVALGAAVARTMPEILEPIIRGLDPTQNIFLNVERAALMRRAFDQAGNSVEGVRLAPQLANELLNAGRIEEAIAIAETLLRPSPEAAPVAPPTADVRQFLALCYLRLGEQQNCITRHTLESCLLPIRGGGVHTEQRGSRAAIREFATLLERSPDDFGARWLFNIASMTVGDYPEGVPRKWLIPARVFAPEHDIKRFPDVAPLLGLDVLGHAGAGIMEDFDADGFLDIVTTSMGVRDPIHYFRNNGDGTFSERAEAAGLAGEWGGLNAVHADYDNDGFPDLFVLRGGWMRAGGRFPNSLLRNRGDGTFEDVTERVGVLSFHPTQTAAWGDYDNDGWLDLFIGNESDRDDPHPSELYHNNRDGTFTDRAINLGRRDLGYIKGVTWGDFNNDGRQDLYVSVLYGDNYLFRNDGKRTSPGAAGEDWQFTDVSRESGTVEPEDSFATWFWDYDNDGWLDLLVTGFAVTDMSDIAAMYLKMPFRTEVPRLYRNNRDGRTFTDVTRAVRLDRVALAMGSNFGDLDNDGWADAYFGTGEPRLSALLPNRLFRNDGGGAFQDVTTSAGVGHIQKGHGVAFGDIDNDGDQDLFEEMGGWFVSDVAHSVLYRNPGHGNHWITLRVEGRHSNRSAIGARIKVRVKTTAGPRDVYATVGTGGSFGGNSLQQEIGLGRALSLETIEVTWPATTQVQVFRDADLDRVYRIIEGEPSLSRVPVKRLPI
jgi:VCBS repeat protein/ASPIC/UnbV protein